MHRLQKLINDVESTHPRLGNAIAFSVVCVKAKMCLLIVSPAGCGKSTISNSVGKAYTDYVRMDSITRSGLSFYTEKFTNYEGVVIIDDVGKVDSIYNRKHTISSFAELCYSHFISKHSMAATVEIEGFRGSAIMNIQPAILAEVYVYPEWESVIQDKTIRYYHLYRPTKPYEGLPDITIDWGLNLDIIHKPDHRYKTYDKLEKIAAVQWSDSRAMEHLDRLLRATAALDKRQLVNGDDMALLLNLMRPMTVEKHIFKKFGFETGRIMESNLSAVLVEFASWKNISIDRIARDYKIHPSTVYKLLADIKEWFVADEPMTKKIKPKKELINALKEAGVKWTT